MLLLFDKKIVIQLFIFNFKNIMTQK